MNKIKIIAPRWKDRTVLIALWKIGELNEIEITCAKKDGTRYYPNPFIVRGEELNQYPIVNHEHGAMREVPLQVLLDREEAK